MKKQDLYDLVIIGAGPAGISAGIYAGRAKLKTLVLDSGQSGGQIGITSEVVNYPGIERVSGKDFTDTMKRQAESFGVKILAAGVESVDFSGDIKKLHTDQGTIEAVGVLIATGAKPRTLGFDGEETFRGRGVGYCATCDGEFFSGLDIFVVGGGFAAAEEAIFLTRYAKRVHIIVRTDDFTCSKTIADKVKAHPMIEVHFNTELIGLEGKDMLEKATLVDNATGEKWTYQAQEGKTFGVFIFVGYEPLSAVFRGHVEMDDYGYIKTDDDMLTSAPGVYAAGDIRPKRLRQLVTAVADGAVAATAAEKYIEHTKEALGIKTEAQPEKAAVKPHESLIDDELSAQLAPIVERFEKPIELLVIRGGDEELSDQLAAFAADFAAIGDNVSVRVIEKGESEADEKAVSADRYPFLALMRRGEGYSGIKFCGVPGGHEFNSFVLALYNAAGPGQETDTANLERIAKIDKPLDIKIGVSLSCTMCPEVVQAAQFIAAHNPNVTAQMIDVSKFIDIRKAYNIMSVPAIIVNDKHVAFGKKSLPSLLDYLSTVTADA